MIKVKKWGLLLFIVLINMIYFGFQTILPDSQVVDEGVLWVEGITPSVASVRYGLFGFLEVGAATNNGGVYLKAGTDSFFNVPVSLSVSYGYQGDLNSYGEAHLIGVTGYTGNKRDYKLSLGADYVQKMETQYVGEEVEPKTTVDHFINIFGGLSYILSSEENTTKLINIEATTGLKLNGEDNVAIYLYGTQIFDKFWFFDTVSLVGGVAMVEPLFPPDLLKSFKIIFGISSRINLFGN